MASIVNPRKSNDRFASLPDVPLVCVSRNKQSRLPWDTISFIGCGIRQTLGSRASHNRRTSFGTVASQVPALCRLSDEQHWHCQRDDNEQTLEPASNCFGQRATVVRDNTVLPASGTNSGSRNTPNDGVPNAFEALIDLLPCGRGGMKPHSKTSIHSTTPDGPVRTWHESERKGRVE